jgi:uncharacterized metal-binding protein
MKRITVPCQLCKEEQEGADAAPPRVVQGGKLIKDDGEDAEFLLQLACGHEIEFTFSQEEKADVLEVIDTSLAEDDNG